ncbi:MAG: PepSY-like domain-containing protein [Muribaculaceae bacterium]|nr:PepSY-like domain-containing protein [Muribaculaceae bacterium]
MKNLFKVLGLALILALGTATVKAERVEMPVEKMPAQVQTFLNDYYPGAAVAKSWAKMMRPTTEPMWYRVNLDNGTKLWFDLTGNWYQVSAKKSTVPVSIDLLPNDARKTITDQCPGCSIKSIKFKKDQYKIKLSDGQKLTFDKTYGLKVKKDKKKDKK